VDDLYLINKVKETGDSEAFKMLAETHSGVYLSVLDRYLPDKFHTQKEDLRQDKDFNLYSAIMSYDPNKGMKFPTFLGQTIKWKCLTLKTRGTDKDTVEYEPLKKSLPEPEYFAPQRKELTEKIFQYAENFDDEVARKVVTMRFSSDGHVVPFRVISEKLQITQREANAAYQRFVEKARKEFSD
jgi:DNA-directed RNA polymerase sigma subunit (sigma70/sigma32)